MCASSPGLETAAKYGCVRSIGVNVACTYARSYMTIIDNPVKALNFIYFNNRNAVNNDWKWIETLMMFELRTVEAFRRALLTV